MGFLNHPKSTAKCTAYRGKLYIFRSIWQYESKANFITFEPEIPLLATYSKEIIRTVYKQYNIFMSTIKLITVGLSDQLGHVRSLGVCHYHPHNKKKLVKLKSMTFLRYF